MRCIARTSIILAGSLGFLTGCHSHPVEQKEIALQLPHGTPKRPHGLVALKVNPGAPQPFTKNDIVNYFTIHNLPMNSGAKDQFHVDTLEFLTSKQVSERLQGVATGLEDNDLVGFVTLIGTFVFSGPKGTHPATFSSAYVVFVASTGRLLMDGSLESGKGDRPK